MSNTTISSLAFFSNPIAFSDNIIFIVLGIIILLLNLLIFAVLISDKALLRRSALIAGIAVSNFLLGLHMLAFGTYRLVYNGNLSKLTSYSSCLSLIFPLFLPLAFNTEASFLILAGLERLLAVTTPTWFRNEWTPKNVWLLSMAAYTFVFGNLAINLLWSIPERSLLNWSCALPIMYGANYAMFMSGFTAAAGLISAVLTSIALFIGIRRIGALPLLSGEAGRIKRQVELTKSMATISCFEVALMVIPNLLSLMTNLGVRLPAFVRPSNSTYTNAVNSMVAFFAFMIFNTKFQNAAIKLLRVQKLIFILKRLQGQEPVQQLTNAPSQSQETNTRRKKNNISAKNTPVTQANSGRGGQDCSSNTRI